MHKAQQHRTTFWRSDIEKLHVAVAWSAFLSKNVQTHSMLRPSFEVQMSKNRTKLWRKAHLQVKTLRNWTDGLGPLFEVQMSKVHFQVTMWKKGRSWTTFEVQMSKTCTLLWHQAHFQVKMRKETDGVGPLFEVQTSKKLRWVRQSVSQLAT